MNNYFQDLLGNILLIAVAFLMAHTLSRRKLFALRAAVSFICMCGWRYIYFNLLREVIPQNFVIVYNMFGFVLLLCCTATVVFACYDCGIWTALFCGSTSYCAQHIVQMLYRIITRLWLTGKHYMLYGLTYVGISALIILCAGLILKIIKFDKILLNNKILFFFTLLMITTSIVIDLLWPITYRNNPDNLRYYLYIYSLICCTLIFFLQISTATNKKIEFEREVLKKIADEEREQYNYEKSIIDMVNIKCHDLKHQISALDGETSKQLRSDVKSIVDAYDNFFKTGNTALDVVLTRKTFGCKDKNIQFTCLADGQCINFMSETDVYSLFGNILDNAIEATEKLEEKDKRTVSLTVSKEKSFVSIRAENYFTGKISYASGEIKTTKTNSVMHGYGLRSIKQIACSYGGDTVIKTDKDKFVIDILLPL